LIQKPNHGGTEDAEKTINAEIAKIAERFDAAGLRSRPGYQAERIEMRAITISLMVRISILSA
jgi:hypothetical protein